MAIRGGSVIHVGNNAVLLSRLQTAGPGTVSVKRTIIYELGNYHSVGQVSDIPDLSFSMESYDASCAMEALLVDKPVGTTHAFDLSRDKVLNVKSAFKPGKSLPDEYGTVGSAAVPALHLESVSYKYGVGSSNASQTANLKGDSLYYNPGSTYVESHNGNGVDGQTFVTEHPAYAIVENGIQRRILAVTVGGRRLALGVDYSESYGAITNSAAVTTLTLLSANSPCLSKSGKVFITYASPDEEHFPQSVHALVSGVYGLLTGAHTSATQNYLSLDFQPKAGDSLIIDDVIGSANVEVVHVVSVDDGVAAVDGVQRVEIKNATGGAYKLSKDGIEFTADIAYNATGVQVQTALEGLTAIAPGDVTVVEDNSSLNFEYDITFGGAFAGVQVAALTSTDTLVGLGAKVEVAVSVRGRTGATTGPWVATLSGSTTHNHALGITVAQYSPTVRPAALRGRDIEIYIGKSGALRDDSGDDYSYSDDDADYHLDDHGQGYSHEAVKGSKRHGVQSASVDWKVTLENDEEMGNDHYVDIDHDVPTVSGSLVFRPQNHCELLRLVQDLSETTDRKQSVGAMSGSTSSDAMDLQIVLKNPLNGRILKRLHVRDARFTLPGYSARVQQKLDLTCTFQSDTGDFTVYDH